MVVFLLGVLVILDALIGTGGSTIPELIIGTVLVGVLPLEYVAQAWHDSAAHRVRRRRADG